MKLSEPEARAILDLEPGANTSTIRQAYLDAVKVWHPDRFKGNPRLEAKALEKLKRINAAYERLAPDAGRTTPTTGRSRPTHAKPAPAPPVPSARDRRGSARVRLRVPVQFRSTRDVGFHSTLDVGAGGIAIGTPHPLGRNEVVPVRFRIPGSNRHVFAQARIVWVKPATAMGLQFLDLAPADHATIAAFVNDHAGTEGMFTVCSTCGALLSVAVSDLGQVVLCPCGRSFTVV